MRVSNQVYQSIIPHIGAVTETGGHKDSRGNTEGLQYGLCDLEVVKITVVKSNADRIGGKIAVSEVLSRFCE